MSQEMSAPKAPAANHDAAEEKPKSGGKGKLLIGLFVSVVVIAETAVFFLMVPSGEDIALLAESRLIEKVKEKEHEAAEAEAGGGGGGGGHGAPAEKGHSAKDGEKIVEFQLGKFGPSFTPVGSDRNYRVEFDLFGTLKQKNEAKLKELFEEKKQRLRYKIMMEIRNASMDELQENQLGLIQRRILATSTELLGEDLLLSVGFADYQIVEE